MVSKRTEFLEKILNVCNDPDRLSRHQLQAAAQVEIIEAIQESVTKEPDEEDDESTKRKRTSEKPKKGK
ncbi:hypothetical protein JTB14_027106 [Gonioctena quinquepunctata]|nr:hypothetical protein JTB14_027106 [Gonioctena quinquepunctata]